MEAIHLCPTKVPLGLECMANRKHLAALLIHFALCLAGWASGRAPGLRATDDAIRETAIGTVLLAVLLCAIAHNSYVGCIAIGCTLLKHLCWVLIGTDIGITDTMILYGTMVLPLVGLWHRCPYILYAGTYSFGTKVIDRAHHDVKQWIRMRTSCCTRAEFEIAKLVICTYVYLVVVLAYAVALRVRRGPLTFTWTCGAACGHLHPRRRRPVAQESDVEVGSKAVSY